jgi:uncharacterized membrane protein YtjA (UPF0391 family)
MHAKIMLGTLAERAGKRPAGGRAPPCGRVGVGLSGWELMFLVIAGMAAVFAEILFFVFLAVFVMLLVLGLPGIRMVT